MNLEDVIREFRNEADFHFTQYPEDNEIYAAVARMLETVAQDIVAEYGEATGRKAIVWESVIHRLGIRL